MVLEACVESLNEAILAQKNGASRVELCDRLDVGGTTPSYNTVKACLQEVKIPAMIMVRPRGGDFVYSPNEYQVMKDDIQIFKELGCKGVVFGLLTSKNKIDITRTQELTQLAKPMEVVFHKAFDELEDPFEGLEQLIEIGVDRVLTSGTKTTALEGQDILRKLIIQAQGRITILAAGRVTSENLHEIQQLIPTGEFHGRKIVG